MLRLSAVLGQEESSAGWGLGDSHGFEQIATGFVRICVYIYIYTHLSGYVYTER